MYVESEAEGKVEVVGVPPPIPWWVVALGLAGLAAIGAVVIATEVSKY